MYDVCNDYLNQHSSMLHPVTLWGACIDEDLTAVEMYLARGDNSDKEHPSSGATPLLLAINSGNIEIVTCLLEFGADPFAGKAKDYPTAPVSCVSLVTTFLAAAKRCASCGALSSPLPCIILR
jgi:hypothetical protein